ncbi:MAG: sugar phosphate isomerase/epimerase [Clostridiales bacterium]|nr:sugar phosphate isomerase/epimerase [Clostridiales bacterium]
MNIGIRLHDTAGTNLSEHLSAARAQGFTCVHIAMSKVIPDFKMTDAPALLTDELAAYVKAELAKNGQTCVLLGCYLNLCSPDLAEHEKTVEIYKAHLRFAKKIGALLVGTETGAPNTTYSTCPECYTDEALALFIDRVTPVVRYAEEVGQLFAIEPVIRHIVATPERCERVLRAIHSPNLKVILDAVNLLGEDNVGNAKEVIADGIARLGQDVALLHMKDFIPYADARGQQVKATVDNTDVFSNVVSCACGLGDMDYAPLCRLARERNIPMTLENTNPGNAEAARRHLEKIGAAL